MHETLPELAAALAEGRHAAALEAVRIARREGGAGFLDLAESEALFGLLRYREALGVATRALARRPTDADLGARLHVVRAQALWHVGRVGPARAEARRTAEKASRDLTRARAFETLGLFAWKDEDSRAARAHLSSARELYAASESAAGLARILGSEAGLLKDAGRLEEAVRAQGQRVELASRTPRIDAIARARADRGAVLLTLGRWAEARRELELAAELFRGVGDPREITLAGRYRATLALAAGDLPAARALVARAHEIERVGGGDPRARAEGLLLSSDLHLAGTELEAAERTAADALALFALVGDPSGDCRSRLRRAQALLALGRLGEAHREARRAVRQAGSLRPSLEAMAQLVLGRVLLRCLRGEAARAFDRALSLGVGDPGLLRTARVGQALVHHGERDHVEVREALAALEAWGDRRLLAFTLADIRSLRGGLGPPAPVAAASPLVVRSRDSQEALVSAALALGGDGDWAARWAGAVRALEPALGFWRAAVVGPASALLHAAEGEAVELPPDDFARAIAPGCETAVSANLLEDPHWRAHPARVLHGLGFALVAPAGPGVHLYLDRREDQAPPGEPELRLLAQLARLLTLHPPCPRPDDRPAPAFPGIIGRCPAMRALFARMALVAAADVDLHICGETGTGKERVARALHLQSRRRQGPFVPVNASSLNDELFEAEMFGHTRGAFTGAIAARTGYVAEAEGGTLFIDEVAELSGRGQAKLLRLLQEREYRRVGEATLRRADVRVISAANTDLAAEVVAGRFRRDLMYRLQVLKLDLPPLRDRGEDVLRLARHFLVAAAQRAGIRPPTLPADVARALAAYSWPGNVRELENEISRLLVLAGGGPLQREHLSPDLTATRTRVTLREAQQAFERGLVTQTLERCGGNRTRAAEELGISRQALLGIMKRGGLS